MFYILMRNRWRSYIEVMKNLNLLICVSYWIIWAWARSNQRFQSLSDYRFNLIPSAIDLIFFYKDKAVLMFLNPWHYAKILNLFVLFINTIFTYITAPVLFLVTRNANGLVWYTSTSYDGFSAREVPSSSLRSSNSFTLNLDPSSISNWN